jgi:hypothetical protein
VLFQWYQVEVYSIAKSKPSEEKCKNDLEIHIESQKEFSAMFSMSALQVHLASECIPEVISSVLKMRHSATSVHPYY